MIRKFAEVREASDTGLAEVREGFDRFRKDFRGYQKGSEEQYKEIVRMVEGLKENKEQYEKILGMIEGLKGSGEMAKKAEGVRREGGVAKKTEGVKGGEKMAKKPEGVKGGGKSGIWDRVKDRIF